MRHRLLLAAACLTAAAASPAQGDETDFPMAMQDIVITSHHAPIQITVRNISASTDPAERELRVVSANPQIEVTGQVWCKTALGTQAYATRVQAMIANVTLWANDDIFDVGNAGQSQIQTFPGNPEIANFDLDFTYEVPESWDPETLVELRMNPVEIVEDRLATFVQNGAGSAADFLRTTDVFETSVPLSVIGWCRWDEYEAGQEYMGVRKREIPVRIFYQGDPDIADPIVTVGGANQVAAQPAERARATLAPARGTQGTPPARTDPPRRARPNR